MLIDCLGEWENFLHNQNIPPLVQAGLLHYQFEAIHPFLDGNGRTGRLLIILQLVERGLLQKPTLYLSEYFEKYRVEYFDALSRVRINGDMEQWLNFFLTGIIETSKKENLS